MLPLSPRMAQSFASGVVDSRCLSGANIFLSFDIVIGSFDDTTEIKPTIQIGLEGKLPLVDELGTLRTRSPEAQTKAAEYEAKVISHQHPDHDN